MKLTHVNVISENISTFPYLVCQSNGGKNYRVLIDLVNQTYVVTGFVEMSIEDKRLVPITDTNLVKIPDKSSLNLEIGGKAPLVYFHYGWIVVGEPNGAIWMATFDVTRDKPDRLGNIRVAAEDCAALDAYKDGSEIALGYEDRSGTGDLLNANEWLNDVLDGKGWAKSRNVYRITSYFPKEFKAKIVRTATLPKLVRPTASSPPEPEYLLNPVYA
ncbi:MAG: hypothetical protein LBO74_02740 [Candidatus Symbiothrix sp.]|jgi:hypothetical protein|nr:hypothetical protein [Candidatus Symbiothrix sp.]